MAITIYRAIKPLVDLGVAALKAANNIWTGSNKFTGTVSLSGAEPAETLTLTEKGLWQDYFDVPSTDQALGAVHFDYPQPSITPAQQATARANIGVVTAGGVELAGEQGEVGGVNGGNPNIPCSGDFTFCATIQRREGSKGLQGALIGFDNNTAIECGVITFGVPVNGNIVRVGYALSSGSGPSVVVGTYPEFFQKSHAFVVQVVGNTAEVFIDGESKGTFDATTLSASRTKVIGIGSIGNWLQFAGTITNGHLFNRALTADERAAVMRGEVPAALAKSGFRCVNGMFSGGGGTGTTDGFASASSYMLTHTTGHTGVAGDVYAVEFSVSTPTTVNITLINPAEGYASSSTTVSSGNHRVLLTSFGAANGAVFDYMIGSTTVSGFSITRIGTVARYEPENVTSLGRWLDASGNGYDLIPGSGITPLKPQPVRSRQLCLGYNLATSTLLYSFGERVPFTPTKVSTGTLDVTMASYLSGVQKCVLPAFRGIDTSSRFILQYPDFTAPNTSRVVVANADRSAWVDDQIDVQISWPE